jgi:phosphatidylinositol kinase/protein kinase (PI-3  family)
MGFITVYFKTDLDEERSLSLNFLYFHFERKGPIRIVRNSMQQSCANIFLKISLYSSSLLLLNTCYFYPVFLFRLCCLGIHSGLT